MRKLKKILGSMLLVCVMCLFSTVSVSAADVEMVLKATESANAGETVYAQISLKANPGISTMGVKMTYNSEILAYENAVWSSDITGNSKNMTLISELPEDNLLNISAIFVPAYETSEETMLTVKFTAKQNFTSEDIDLVAKDITDANEANLSVNISKGTISSESQGGSGEENSESQNGTQSSEEENNSGNNNSENNNSENNNSESNNSGNGSTGNTNSESNNSGAGSTGNTNSGNGNSGNNNSGSSSESGNLDETFKTGSVDARIVLGVIAVVLVGVAAVCIKVLRKREY